MKPENLLWWGGGGGYEYFLESLTREDEREKLYRVKLLVLGNSTLNGRSIAGSGHDQFQSPAC